MSATGSLTEREVGVMCYVLGIMCYVLGIS
jgi:hypothetical protein